MDAGTAWSQWFGFAAMLAIATCAWFVYLVVRFSRADADLTLLSKGRAPKTAFTDKVVWVVGASQGLGELLSIELAARGATVILSSRGVAKLTAVRQKCIDAGGVAEVLPLDVTGPNVAVKAAASTAVELAGPGGIDAVFLVAGASQRALIEATDADVDRKMFELNVLGSLAVAKAILPHFLSRGAGHYVVVSSIAGKVGAPVQATYAATKHALHGFFNALRAEVGSRGIDVTLICPGPTAVDESARAVFGGSLAPAAAPAASQPPTQGAGVGSAERMAPVRCVSLILAAAAHRVPEAWVAKHPVLAFAYVSQYFPGLAAWASPRIGAKRVASFKRGESIYAGLTGAVMGGGAGKPKTG